MKCEYSESGYCGACDACGSGKKDRDELDRIKRLLDEADVVYRDEGQLLSTSERVSRVLADLAKYKGRSKKQSTHACDLPGCVSCGNPEQVECSTCRRLIEYCGCVSTGWP